jgi:hypothetical protein
MKPAIYIPDFINAIDLAGIKRDRKKIALMRADLLALSESLREREEGVITALEAGIPVDGDAEVLTRRRQNISWLTIVRRELGTSAIEQVKNEWPVSLYKALQIA